MFDGMQIFNHNVHILGTFEGNFENIIAITGSIINHLMGKCHGIKLKEPTNYSKPFQKFYIKNWLPQKNISNSSKA